MPSRELRLPGVRRGELVRFTCGREPVEAFEGESVAAALLASGRRTLEVSPRRGEPRGLFCAMGACFDCTLTIDGRTGERACTTPVREGMVVEGGPWGGAMAGPADVGPSGDEETAAPAPEVGASDRALTDQEPTHQPPTEAELLVVGAGPGGLCAAIAAARAGDPGTRDRRQSEAGRPDLPPEADILRPGRGRTLGHDRPGGAEAPRRGLKRRGSRSGPT